MKIEHDPEKGCEDCPFRGVRFSRFCDEPADADDVCNAFGRRDIIDNRAPAWCPLRSGDVTVTARSDLPALEVGNERGRT